MEVKTVKTTKSDIKRKKPSKSATIWDQTVSAITQASNDIFEKFQNFRPLAIFWVLKFFDFVKIWGHGGRLKNTTLKYRHFRHNLCLDAHISGLEWSFAKL